MAMSDALRQEVAAMAKIEQVLSGLPDRSRYRVTGWVLDNFSEPDAPTPEFEARVAQGTSI